MDYWELVEPVWGKIDIYSDPVVFLENFESANANAATLFAAHFCYSEVYNGGFHQFFYNPTGVLAPEAVRAFHAIGQHEVARVIETALAFFGPEYPRQRSVRQARLAKLGKTAFADLDEKFYDLMDVEGGGFENAADAFAERAAKENAQHQK